MGKAGGYSALTGEKVQILLHFRVIHKIDLGVCRLRGRLWQVSFLFDMEPSYEGNFDSSVVKVEQKMGSLAAKLHDLNRNSINELTSLRKGSSSSTWEVLFIVWNISDDILKYDAMYFIVCFIDSNRVTERCIFWYDCFTDVAKKGESLLLFQCRQELVVKDRVN